MRKELKSSDKNISLKEYFDNRFLDLKEYMDLKFNNIEKSTCLAQDNLNARLESMNEFRNSMKDQASNFITRNEHELLITKIDTDVKYAVAQIKSDMLIEQSRTRWIVAEIVIIFGVVITVIFSVLNYLKV